MLGAIIGDILGSVHERIPSKGQSMRPMALLDDSFLTCSCQEWVNNLDISKLKKDKISLAYKKQLKEEATFYLKKWWAKYPRQGYSSSFNQWAQSSVFIQGTRNTNGSIMRESPIAVWCVKNNISMNNAIELAKIFASPTHDHPETYSAVQSHTSMIYLSAKQEITKEDIKTIHKDTPYSVQSLEHWKQSGKFIWDSQNSLAISYSALYHAHDFQSTIDNCIYIGGDVDTYCAIACPIAQNLWGIPISIIEDMKPVLKKYSDIYELYSIDKLSLFYK